MPRHSKMQREESLAVLRTWLKPGDTVYTILRHVSPSGMTRWISAYVLLDGEPRSLDFHAAVVLDWTRDLKHEGVKVGGCGMDMGFHLVYSLSQTVFRDGFVCTGEDCPSSEHVGSNRDRSYEPHPHRDGGYALKQRWL